MKLKTYLICDMFKENSQIRKHHMSNLAKIYLNSCFFLL